MHTNFPADLTPVQADQAALDQMWTAHGPYILRSAIGKMLLGREVRYPTENPSPPASTFREGTRTIANYTAALETFGVTVTA